MDSILASHLAATGSNPHNPQIFFRGNLKLLRLFDGTAQNSGQRILANTTKTYFLLFEGVTYIFCQLHMDKYLASLTIVLVMQVKNLDISI